MKKPELKETPILEELETACKAYVDYVGSDEYNEDYADNYRNEVFEKALEAFYSIDVWDYINEN